MSDSDSDSEQPTVSGGAAAAVSSRGNLSAEELAALRAKRKEVKAAAKAAKKAARPPPEVHLKNVPMLCVTCDAHKEMMAKKEMLAWMNDYAERHFAKPASAAAAAAAAPQASVSSGLEAELAAMRAEAAAERASSSGSSSGAAASAALGVRFKIVGDMALFRGLFLIAVLDPSIDLVSMVEGMLDEVRSSKQFRTRYCVHLHPFAQTCYSDMDSMLKMAKLIVPPQFGALAQTQPEDKRKYCIELVRRGHHSQMERDRIIKEVAALVPEQFTVDLKHADIVLLVEVIGRTTGIAVLTRYAELHKLNIRTLFEHVTGVKQEAEEKQSAPGEGKNKKRKLLQQQQQEQQQKKAGQADGAEESKDGEAVAEDSEQQASSKKARKDATVGDAAPSAAP
jgi:hypothetical protein